MPNERTLIVGGGIVGLSTAYFLARRGAPVVLLQRNDFSDSASTGNAGLVAVGHGPLPRPGLVTRGLKWMLDGDSPLYIPPRLDLDLMRWLIGFARACGTRRHEHAWRVMMEHGMHAGACFRDLVERESIDCAFRETGQLDVFASEGGFAAGRAEANVLRRHGYAAETMSGRELAGEDPAFRDGLAGAIAYTDRMVADPHAFVLGLADATRQHGAELRTNAPVETLLVDGARCSGARLASGEVLEAGHVVLAAGVWSSALADAVGAAVPMQAGKGYYLDVEPPDPAPRFACVLAETFVAVNPMPDRLRLAGTLEFSGINDRLVERRVRMLAEGASQYISSVPSTVAGRSWCGLRPCTADGVPAVGPTRVPGLTVATGHAMMGFLLGPLTGRLVTESILDGQTSLSIEPLSPRRFAS
jgi:D-amino-acid dehydrogenase